MVSVHAQLTNSTLRRVIKRPHFPLEVMLVCVRWYAAYTLSLSNLAEMMAERGVMLDHATIHSPLGSEDAAGAGRCVSPAQAASGQFLAYR